ncbi:hypothetical protein [Qipengyuania mesophila]|uniref:hypothetical protein n=1 Tax=Qipengyuania mesophila TaxID=2867246 RepID=UPI003516255C
MLQIIGWLGCFYLVVKAIEFFVTAKANVRNKDAAKWSNVGAFAALFGAFVFMVLINGHAQKASDLSLGTAYPSYGSDAMYEDPLSDVDPLGPAMVEQDELANAVADAAADAEAQVMAED